MTDLDALLDGLPITPASHHGFQKVPIELRFWPKVAKSEGCWLWTGSKTHKGYGLTSDGNQSLGAHRVSWQLAYGDIPPGLFVCHHCDNPSCVRPDHLFLGTNRDNQLDASAKGRLATGARNGVHKNTLRGEMVGNAKATTQVVLAIRASSETLAVLSRRYGLSITQVSRIRRREGWTHV